MEARGTNPNPNPNPNQIHAICVKTLIAAQPHICSRYGQRFRRRNACFEVFGFDVLLDAAGAAHLLEINCNPSMRVDDDPQAPFSPDRRTVSPLDERVKRRVLGGALSLVLGLGADHAAWWDELPPAPRASFFE